MVKKNRPSNKRNNNNNKTSKQLTRLGSALRSLGGMGGSIVGGLVGQPGIGSEYGTSLGASLSRWLGSGDYQVTQNSIVRQSMNASSAIPAMHKDGQSITIRHKEYIGEIRGSTAFTVQRYFIIQPGDSNTFPWLHNIASQFQQYKVKGMVYHYVPTSGSAVSSTNPALGSVMLQTSYRANDAIPASKVEMLNEYWSTEAAPNVAFCHPVECDPKENPYNVHYVRTKPTPDGDSPLLYDLGKTFVATSGMPANNNVVGDLWVTYEIELSKPLVNSDVTGTINNTYYSHNSPATNNLFGATDLGTVSGTLGVTFNQNEIKFPTGTVGTFLITTNVVATTNFTGMDLSGSFVYTNCAAATVDSTGAFYARTVATGSSVLNRGIHICAVTITNPAVNATIVYPNMTWVGSASRTDVIVSQLA